MDSPEKSLESAKEAMGAFQKSIPSSKVTILLARRDINLANIARIDVILAFIRRASSRHA